MSLYLVQPARACQLRDLPMTQQLFLWSLRHLVCAAEDQRDVCPLVAQFFDDAGLPRTLGLIAALLHTLRATTRESLTVNIPCGTRVLPDESHLLRDLFARHNGRFAAHPSVAQRMRDVAVQFAVLDTMRGKSTAVAVH